MFNRTQPPSNVRNIRSHILDNHSETVALKAATLRQKFACREHGIEQLQKLPLGRFNVVLILAPVAETSTITRFGRESEESNGETMVENRKPSENSKLNHHGTQAMAWFKQEEVKIQAWESHEKRKAKMKMKRKQ
nr:hypothetical protein [Tanacetum cinerariifolium]